MIIFPAPGVTTLQNAPISIDGLLLGLALDGVKWSYTRLDGWGMGAGIDTSFSPRPGVHGAFDGPAYRRERVITIEGTLAASTRALALRAQETLAATLADGSMGTFAVADPDIGIRQAKVRLSSTPQSDGTYQGVGVIHWQLQFTAPDHRKYGDVLSVSTPLPGGSTGIAFPLAAPFNFGAPPSTGTVTVTNSGTAPTEPQFSVSGPLLSGFQLTHVDSGRRLLFPSPVSSTPVLIDCFEGTASSGGQDRTGLLSVDDFFTIPAGASASFQFATLGTETATDPAEATVTVAPAYF